MCGLSTSNKKERLLKLPLRSLNRKLGAIAASARFHELRTDFFEQVRLENKPASVIRIASVRVYAASGILQV